MELIFKSETAQKRIENIRTFLLSDKWMILLSCLAGIIIVLSHRFPEAQIEIKGTIFFAYIIGVVLVLSKDIMAGLIPFMLTYMIAIKCYDSFDKFMAYKWYVIPLVFMVLFYILAYFKPLKAKGSQFKPMFFVSVAILLGGIGFISPQEYFSGSSIYHMLGLGFGMLLVYSYFYAHIDMNAKYSVTKKLTEIMVMTGLVATFMVFSYYLVKINHVLDVKGIIYMQWRNNCSTILMLAIPFAFLMANKKSYATTFGFLFYLAILLTGSRGGMVFGAIELVMCIVMFMLYDRRRRLAYAIIIVCLLFGILAFTPEITKFLGYTIDRLFNALNDFLIGESNEIRAKHYARGIKDFFSQPILGTGLGYMGNRDIHPSKEFALCWYHCEPIQIAASFGVVGIIAFVNQFIRRNMLIWRKATLFNMTIFLSYISLEMMSLVNPGILCPLPYLMLITLFMVVVEKCDGEYKDKLYITTKQRLADFRKQKENA